MFWIGGLGAGFAFTAPGKVPFLAVDAGRGFDLAGTFVGEGAESADYLPFEKLVGFVVTCKAFTTLEGMDTRVFGWFGLVNLAEHRKALVKEAIEGLGAFCDESY